MTMNIVSPSPNPLALCLANAARRGRQLREAKRPTTFTISARRTVTDPQVRAARLAMAHGMIEQKATADPGTILADGPKSAAGAEPSKTLDPQ